MRLHRLSRLLPGALALAGLMMLGLASSARAGLIITVQEDSGPIQTFSVGGSPTSDLTLNPGTITTLDYKIQGLFGEANQTTSPFPSVQGSEVVSITNETGNSGHVLTIIETGSGYTAPTTPPDADAHSHIGGTVVLPNGNDLSNSMTFQSAVNLSNLGPQPIDLTGLSGKTFMSDLGAENDPNAIFPSLPASFSITQTITVTLSGLNEAVGYQATTYLQSAVPEPVSLALLGIGLSGLFTIRRFFKRASAA